MAFSHPIAGHRFCSSRDAVTSRATHESKSLPIARKTITRVIKRIGVVALLIGASPFRASATLGSDVPSISDDRVKMQGALVGITRNDRFDVHQMQSASGTTVREYVSTTGTVFAVSWEGPWMPDLRQVLGPYFDAYQRNLPLVRSSRRSHGPITIRSGDLVVQIGGHPRAFAGRAYIERLLPPGMQPEAIR